MKWWQLQKKKNPDTFMVWHFKYKQYSNFTVPLDEVMVWAKCKQTPLRIIYQTTGIQKYLLKFKIH